MMTVAQVSKLTGASVRTLHHYDKIGLLRPTCVTEAGYRLYDREALGRLQLILLFRELEFPLMAIKQILDAPNFDRDTVLQQQIELLRLRRAQLEDLIRLAENIIEIGVNHMDFKAFDKKKQLEYAAKAKERWGGTDAYAQFAQKASGRTEEAETTLAGGLMGLFAELGTLERNPASAEAQAWARRLQAYISEHYYDCTKPILKSLGQMYADGGEMNANIDHAGGKGTGAFAKEILDIFCG